MAKANLILPSGTKVHLEGTAEEIAVLMSKFSGGSEKQDGAKRPEKKKHSAPKEKGAKYRSGPTGLVLDLINEGYFKSRRTLPEVQKKLEEKGHIYAQTSLSPILIRLVRRKDVNFRRIKDKKGWIYVG